MCFDCHNLFVVGQERQSGYSVYVFEEIGKVGAFLDTEFLAYAGAGIVKASVGAVEHAGYLFCGKIGRKHGADPFFGGRKVGVTLGYLFEETPVFHIDQVVEKG